MIPPYKKTIEMSKFPIYKIVSKRKFKRKKIGYFFIYIHGAIHYTIIILIVTEKFI